MSLSELSDLENFEFDKEISQGDFDKILKLKHAILAYTWDQWINQVYNYWMHPSVNTTNVTEGFNSGVGQTVRLSHPNLHILSDLRN